VSIEANDAFVVFSQGKPLLATFMGKE